jgi:NitT/TauT family transport system substrate-binding protein
MAGAILLAAALASCGAAADAAKATVNLRLGYQTNLTHAPALLGASKGFLTAELPTGTTLTTKTFASGPPEIEALLGGSLDAAFIGPSPVINAFTKTKGSAVRVVAGATSGGASLVVRGSLNIQQPGDLRGLKIATPQLGNTQDVALRAYLADHDLKADAQGGGDVHVVPTDNSNALLLFGKGQLDGAWVPEPWASRLVTEAHGVRFVDEASLWPKGQFPTTELVVSTKLLADHRDVVEGLIRGELTTLDWIAQNSASARDAAGAALTALTRSKPLAPAVLASAWSRLGFTVDPLAAAFSTEAANAHRVGLLDTTTLSGIVDIGPLNDILKAAGRPLVDSGGLAST